MRTAVERAHALSPAGAAAVAATVLLLGAACFEGSVVWVGLAALLYALALGVPVLLGRVARPALNPAGLAAICLLAAFVVWNGVSIGWSVLPDRSWDYLNLGLVYLAFAACGVLAATFLRPRDLAGAVALVLGAVAVWALAAKVFPGLYPDYERAARLRSPVGYWNALALLGDFALPLGLWLASRRERRPLVRAGGVLLVYAWIVAILLAFSRGGVLVGVVVVAAWLVLDPRRLESLAALALAAVPALAISRFAFTLDGIVSDGQPASVRAHDGWVFGAVLVGVAAAVAVASVSLPRYELSPVRRRLVGRAARIAGPVAALALVAAVAVAAPRAWDDLRSPGQVGSGAGRIGSVNSNLRTTWWSQAARGFAERPLLGSGAGSFQYTNLRLRTYDVDQTLEPHDLPLQFLSETGIVGFLLAAGAAGAGLWALRRRLGEEGATALALVPVAYLLHGLIDFDWDFVAVTGPAILVGAALLARPGPAAARSRVGAVAAVAGAVAVFASLLMPWLSERYTLDAFGEPPARAISLAQTARSLDPLAVEPIFVQAAAEDQRGNRRRAFELYARAVDLQPHNKETWFRLGDFLWQRGCPHAALPYLEKFTELDPQGYGGAEYNTVLATVNAGKGTC
jgi:O-antigen ligase